MLHGHVGLDLNKVDLQFFILWRQVAGVGRGLFMRNTVNIEDAMQGRLSSPSVYGHDAQLVLMNLKPGEEIGEEAYELNHLIRRGRRGSVILDADTFRVGRVYGRHTRGYETYRGQPLQETDSAYSHSPRTGQDVHTTKGG